MQIRQFDPPDQLTLGWLVTRADGTEVVVTEPVSDRFLSKRAHPDTWRAPERRAVRQAASSAFKRRETAAAVSFTDIEREHHQTQWHEHEMVALMHVASRVNRRELAWAMHGLVSVVTRTSRPLPPPEWRATAVRNVRRAWRVFGMRARALWLYRNGEPVAATALVRTARTVLSEAEPLIMLTGHEHQHDIWATMNTAIDRLLRDTRSAMDAQLPIR
jgi:hypothetical protein